MVLLQRMSEIRKERGLSQEKVAQVLQIPQQQYSRYESGKNEIPVRHVIALCKFYGISADWLLGLTEE